MQWREIAARHVVELFCARETRFRRICPKTAQYEGVFVFVRSLNAAGLARLGRAAVSLDRLSYLKCIL